MEVTVRQFEISSGVSGRFKPQCLLGLSAYAISAPPLLRFWTMDPWLPGVLQRVAVTVRQFNVNSGLFSL